MLYMLHKPALAPAAPCIQQAVINPLWGLGPRQLPVCGRLLGFLALCLRLRSA